MAKDARTVDEVQPEQFVMPAGEQSSLFPPVEEDLIFKRDHRLKGLAYRANVEPWFQNGSQNGGPTKVEQSPGTNEKEPDER